MVATPRFLAEIQGSHTVFAYVDVVGPTGATVTLDVTDGDIVVDRTATTRRTISLSCVDPLGVLAVKGNAGILTPYGTELFPWRGVRYADGTTEVYPLGVFRLSQVGIVEAGSSTGGGNVSTGGSANSGSGINIGLQGYDRSWKVSRDKFLVPYTIATGTNVVNAIQLILARSFPNLTYDAITSTAVTPGPLVYAANDDPWADATSLAVSIGCDLYFDATGNVVIAPPIDLAAHPSPVAKYVEGPGCTMTAIGTMYDDSPGFNGVVVTGASLSSTTAPVTATSWDNSPSSPTYYLGPYGRVPTFVDDQTITTVAQAQASADAILKGLMGATSTIALSTWGNPTLEAGDIIQVQRLSVAVNGLYSIQSFDIPMLASEYATIQARALVTTGS